MRRIVLWIVIAIAVVTVAVQLILPAVIEHNVAGRIEEGGGKADVSITSRPALRLIFGDGQSFRATGQGLAFDLRGGQPDVFDRLDGFGSVDIRFSRLMAGPVRVSRFRLTRDGDAPYRLTMAGSTSPKALAADAGARAGGLIGSLLGSAAGGVLPGGGVSRVPLALDAEIASRDGRPDVQTASGSVNGFPAGPLTVVVVRAVLARL
jgi:hypothetical protein